MSPSPVPRDVILAHLARVLASSAFGGAERSIAMLRVLVERTVDGDGDRLKEYTVGVEALGRGTSFDPRTDPIVRAEASRLRSRLERYYADEGRDDELIIELPKGTYVPRFATRLSKQVESEPAPPQSSGNRWRTRARASAWLVVGSAAVLSAFTLGARVAKPPRPAAGPALMRLDVQLQATGSIGSEVGTDVVMAPDGSGVVFVSTDSTGVSRVRLRRFDRSSSVDLPGTEGARGPFWSPDARWVGFWAHGQLKKTSIDGGSPVVLCDAPDLLGASWGEDKSIVATIDATNRLVRVSAAGGAPSTLLDLHATGVTPEWPQLLPGGSAVLYTAIAGIGADRGSIEVASLSNGRRTVLVKGGTFGRFVAPHYLTYVNQGTLYAVRFDPRRLETRGTPVPIIDDVAYSPTFGFAQVAFSDSGVLIYRRALSNGQSIVAMIDSAGHVKPLVTTPGRYTWPTLSPDGRRLALSVVESGVTSISIFDDLNSTPRRAASIAPGGPATAWMADGRFLIIGTTSGLTWVPASGGAPAPLLTPGHVSAPWSVSPDGRRLAFGSVSPQTAFDLWTVPVEETGGVVRSAAPEVFLQSPFYETYPTFSPDGRWLAYASNESGSWEVYVRAFPDGGTPVQVSRDGGRVPRWSATGHEIFYGTDDQRLMVASYTIHAGTFVPGRPRQWTHVRLADTGVFPDYDLARDGHHIVALVPAGQSAEMETANQATMVLHFTDELRRRVP
jgi:serine/threonine-protein kinase